MSKEVDERVVSMQFDNRNFESNVHTSLNTLDKLKNSLKLPGIAKGLESVDAAAKGMDMNPLARAVETVGLKFNAMQIMATTALMNITNSAINTGKRIVAAFTIDPVKTGLQEYETQINAVQTILANTSSKGTTLEQVNDALDELNHYADMTIYNFTEMTRNIGTFTAAGVDLDTSVSAIKGIANLAAVSGSTSLQASTAMYQLSQALAAGKVQLMDWNSVVNAGMGGQVFQDALKETARVEGIAIDDMIEKHGSFRETLQEGWLTSEVLTKTLAKFTGDLSEAQLKEMGYTEEQIKEIIKLGQTANDAATKVKTFTQLMDTLKEAAQSGWTQTWEILIGDFEEAKSLWTSVSDYFSEVLNKSAEARNNMLQAWAEAGGRGMAIDSIKNVFQGLLSIITPIKEAFREIFPRTTAEQLLKITKSIKEITSKFKLGEKASADLKATFKGLFAIIDIGVTVVKSIVSAIAKLFGGVTDLGGGILSVTGSLGNYLVGVRDSIKETGTFGSVLGKLAEIIRNVFGRLTDVIGYINQKLVAPGFKAFYSLLMGIWNVLKWIGGKVKEVLSNVADGLKDAFQNGDLANATTLLGGGLFVAILLKLKKFIKGLTNPLEDLSGILDKVKDIFGAVGDALKAWQQELQAKTLLKIAAAIGILAASILVIATIEPARLAASLGAITALFAELMGAMAVFAKISGNVKGVAKASLAMISMSISVLILAGALKTIASIDSDDLMKSLLGLAATFAILIVALSYMSKIDKMGKGASKLLPIAVSLVVFASALKILSSISWSDMQKSLFAMISTFAIVLTAMAVMAKVDKIGKGAGKLVVISISLVILAASMKILATMGWEQIGKSLVAMTGAFVILLAAMTIMSKVDKFGAGAGKILVMAASLNLIATALKIVGSMGWESIAKSLVGIGVTLGLMVAAMTALSAIGPMSIVSSAAMVVMAAAIAILVPPLLALSLISWEGLAKGLVAIAGAFAIMGVAGLVLGPLLPVILGLAAALALVGAATFLFGAGLVSIGAGLTSLSVGLAANAAGIVAGLTVIIQGIIGLIPMVIVAIGKGLISILDVIAGAGKSIFNAVKTILVSAADAVIEAAPKIVKAVFVLLDTILSNLVEYTPKIVAAVVNILASCIQGIADGLPKIVEAATNVIVSFVNGISANLPKVIQAGFDMIINFLDGLANAIEKNIPVVAEKIRKLVKSMIKAGKDALLGGVKDFTEAGKNLVTGLTDGIKSKFEDAKKAIKSLGTTVLTKLKSALGEHSPSRFTKEMGVNLDKGLINGIKSYSTKVEDASAYAGEKSVDAMSEAISGVANSLDSDMDAQPTIRPVVDLSAVKSGANKVNDLFGLSPSVGVLSNVNAINSTIGNGQNGSVDVISAIRDLGRKIANTSGNVYNINGVTYDDGSAVANAIGSLVRAARIERRI